MRVEEEEAAEGHGVENDSHSTKGREDHWRMALIENTEVRQWMEGVGIGLRKQGSCLGWWWEGG